MRLKPGPDAAAVLRACLIVSIVVLAPIVVACSSNKTETRPTPVAPSPIRGTEEAADSVQEQDRTEVYRTLLRNFYRPAPGQARWIDPHPLGEKRGSSDTTIRAVSDDETPPDAGWAAFVVEASGMQRVCVLGGAEDDCRGRTGGILRFSPVYAAGPRRVHVFARYTPHGGAVGPITELRFTLGRRSDSWRIVDRAPVSNP